MELLLNTADEDAAALEATRLEARRTATNARRQRTQFIGATASYDATQGVATLTTNSGTFIAESITTGLLGDRIGLSVPRLGNQGKVDAKPV